jgi:hypothetical protein
MGRTGVRYRLTTSELVSMFSRWQSLSSEMMSVMTDSRSGLDDLPHRGFYPQTSNKLADKVYWRNVWGRTRPPTHENPS